MSDTKQSEDWWRAADGKWYPPESTSGYQVGLAERRSRQRRRTTILLASLGGMLFVALLVWMMFNAHGPRPENCATGSNVATELVATGIEPQVGYGDPVTVRSEANPDIWYVASDLSAPGRDGHIDIGVWAVDAGSLTDGDAVLTAAAFSVNEEADLYSTWPAATNEDVSSLVLVADPANDDAYSCMLIHGG